MTGRDLITFVTKLDGPKRSALGSGIGWERDISPPPTLATDYGL